jgi:phosphate/sulfate permease
MSRWRLWLPPLLLVAAGIGAALHHDIIGASIGAAGAVAYVSVPWWPALRRRRRRERVR